MVKYFFVEQEMQMKKTYLYEKNIRITLKRSYKKRENAKN
jgi:hypothetical protein